MKQLEFWRGGILGKAAARVYIEHMLKMLQKG